MNALPSGKDYKSPGLISREIIGSDEENVTIREVWDPRVEGCPLLVFKPMTWPMEIIHDAESVTRTFKVPHYGDKPDFIQSA